MPTSRPRIQVTIDDELAAALDAIEPQPASRSKLVRDLALRGAEALIQERDRRSEAVAVLLEIADGTRDHDFAAVAEIYAARGDRLP